MARILSVGIATLDIINRVARYPVEDTEIRALGQHRQRGGNASNTAVVLSQLGHQVDFAGVLIDEPDLALILADLDAYQVGYQCCPRLKHGKMPTSYITLSDETGSRSIVHHRDCPELDYTDFQKIDLTVYDWLHFEGRNVAETRKMLAHAATIRPQLPRSVELEKPRPGIEKLLEHADFVMAAQPFAEAKGFDNAADFLSAQPFNHGSCSWGADGVWAKQAATRLHQPVTPTDKVVDTLGAGDTLNAGLIHGLLQNWPFSQVVAFASQLATLKCQQQGFTNLHRILETHSS